MRRLISDWVCMYLLEAGWQAVDNYGDIISNRLAGEHPITYQNWTQIEESKNKMEPCMIPT